MLVVVSGPPGAGKTTLAHKIALAVGSPAICRDEIKEGMVHATQRFVPGSSEQEFFTRLDQAGVLVRKRFSTRNPAEVTGYAVALPGDTSRAGPGWRPE